MLKKIKYAIEMNNITMAFGNFKANDNITLKVKKGEIHALIGENGAGKSTLMSVLFGIYKKTSGTIKINGRYEYIKSPLIANELGIGMVHQHFKLVESFNVLQNIVLNIENTYFNVFLSYKEERKKVTEIMNKYNFHIDLYKKISNCSVAEQQRVEILKMLYRNSDILIFDEPTAVLSPIQIEEFLKALKNLKEKGKTIVLISHKLDEIKKVSSRGTIIRKGKFIKEVNLSKITNEKLAELMVGTKIENAKNKYEKIDNNEIFNINNLSMKKLGKKGVEGLKNFNLKINSGEIVAIAGVEGNGQTELINAITGLQHFSSGKIMLKTKEGFINGKKIKYFSEWSSKKMIKLYKLKSKTINLEKKGVKSKSLQKKVSDLEKKLKNIRTKDVVVDISKKSIKNKYRLGMSHIPEDRHKYGLVLDFDLNNNSIIQDFYKSPYSNHGILSRKEIKKYTNEIITNFDVRSSFGASSLARSLSGGNQQKMIVGRELSKNSSFLIVAQPTRGLDVGAIENIHNYILKAKKAKKAILLISYELDEIIALADRIIVLNSGRNVGEKFGKGISKKVLGELMANTKQGGFDAKN